MKNNYCVLAPVPSKITHLDKPTHDGNPLKNDDIKLPKP